MVIPSKQQFTSHIISPRSKIDSSARLSFGISKLSGFFVKIFIIMIAQSSVVTSTVPSAAMNHSSTCARPSGDKVMFDPVNRPPDEDPPGTVRLNDRQKACLDRKHCNALLESIKDERHGLLWWQSTPISYCFSDSIVRDRLLKLMKSETVRLMDRNYMMTLSDRLIEANWELVHNRIEARRKWEVDREKQLVFEGKLPLSDGPPGFAKHPFFHEDNKVRKRLAEEEAKKMKRRGKKSTGALIKVPTFDYSGHKELTFKVEEELGDDELEETDKDECLERVYLEHQLQKEAEDKIVDPPDYHEKHYEAIGVKQIKHALTVDRMFKCADRIFLKLF